MKFRDDIDLENTYVVADTHFGHDNIVDFCHRPTDHESVIVERWAQAVPDEATVLHLGDFAYKGNARVRALIAPHLTGKNKKIILGNHDGGRFSFYKSCGFQIIQPFVLAVSWSNGKVELFEGVNRQSDLHDVEKMLRDYADCTIVSFAHYPWGEPDDHGAMPDGHLRIHGHIHNNGYERDAFVPFLKDHINVSIEQTKYRPVNLANLLSGVLLGHSQVQDDGVQKGIPQTHEKVGD